MDLSENFAVIVDDCDPSDKAKRIHDDINARNNCRNCKCKYHCSISKIGSVFMVLFALMGVGLLGWLGYTIYENGNGVPS